MENLSTTGYKRNSPDKDKPYNVIPSGDITMEDVDFPVLGIDNTGKEELMMPGEKEINFPGNTVLEIPMLGNTLQSKSEIYNRIFNK
jgi:hypothetical protein